MRRNEEQWADGNKIMEYDRQKPKELLRIFLLKPESLSISGRPGSQKAKKSESHIHKGT